MKTYVLDVLENALTEEEANQYYYKAFIEMDKRERIPYIVNENRYLKFLLRLYKMDKNVVYKFRFFEKWCFDFLKNSEKLHYKNSIKKLRRKALNKKKFFSKDKDILEMIFKMSFRDVFGFQKNYRIYFSNLKILITSLTDYYYFITFLDKDEERVKNLVKKSKLFLKWGRNMEVRYDVYLEDENEDNISDEVDFDAPMKRLELIFSHITEEEKEILEKYNFKYEYTEDNKIKLIDEDCAIYYTIEIDDEDKGIYLEETKTYYNYFKYDFNSRENERTKNLVISKEGVRVEIIFNERRW